MCWTSPLQDETPVCHNCLVVNETSQFTINAWSPVGNCNKSFNVWSLARAPEYDIEFGVRRIASLYGNRGVSSGEQGLRYKLRERIGLLKLFVYCKC